MTLQDILQAIDTLPAEDLDLIEQRIHDKKKVLDTPFDKSVWEQEWIKDKLAEIDHLDEAVELVAGTMNTHQFLTAMRAMHDELSDDDIEAITQAMNEEYIPEDAV